MEFIELDYTSRGSKARKRLLLVFVLSQKKKGLLCRYIPAMALTLLHGDGADWIMYSICTDTVRTTQNIEVDNPLMKMLL